MHLEGILEGRQRGPPLPAHMKNSWIFSLQPLHLARPFTKEACIIERPKSSPLYESKGRQPASYSVLTHSGAGAAWALRQHLLWPRPYLLSFFLFFFFCVSFLLFGATPAAYGSSQDRGQIGAVAAGHTTATATPDPSCVCDLHQCWILNPLHKARERTHVLMDASQFC